MLFAGIDLGWNGKPSGVALLELMEDSRLVLTHIWRLDHHDEVLKWLADRIGVNHAIVAVDAPLIIENDYGQRLIKQKISFRKGNEGVWSEAFSSALPARSDFRLRSIPTQQSSNSSTCLESSGTRKADWPTERRSLDAFAY